MNPTDPGRGPGYEATDAPSRALAIVGAVLAGGVLVAMGVAALVNIGSIRARETAERLGEPGVFTHGPHQVHGIQQSWQEIEREQAARSHGYAWVDREHGIVRIPVERAMELLAQEAEEERR